MGKRISRQERREDKYLLLGEETPGLKYTDSFAEPKSGAADSKGQGQSKEDVLKKTDGRPPGTAIARPTTAAVPGNGGGMDPSILQNMLNEAKLQSQEQIEAERSENRALISAKDGKIAKLEAVVETLVRENEKLESDLTTMRAQLDRLSQSGGQALRDSEAEVARLRSEVDTYKSKVVAADFARAEETTRLRALQQTLSNLTAGESDRVSREQKASEERANEQRER